MNKSAVSAWVVLIVFIIIAVVFGAGFLLYQQSIYAKTTQLSEETGFDFQKKALGSCDFESPTTFARFGGWGDNNFTSRGTDRARSFDADTGFYALQALQINDSKDFLIGVLDMSWDTATYDNVRFSYKMKPDTGLCLIVDNNNTVDLDYYILAKTEQSCNVTPIPLPIVLDESTSVQLLDANGKWNEVSMVIDENIRVNAAFFWADSPTVENGTELLLDNFIIASDRFYTDQFYCTGFEDDGYSYSTSDFISSIGL